jgi:oxygen-dependent protoporphyrinogen oxidase
MSPPAFLRSPVLSLRGRLRVLFEPLVPRRIPSWETGDESVYAFAARRIGHEAAGVLVDAMVSGIFAGNARELSLQSAFPKMAAMEREHGSLFRALLARRREARRDPSKKLGGPAGPAGHLTSFQHGMQELTDTLAARLGDRLTTGRQVERVSRGEGGVGYCLHLAGGEVIAAERLLLSSPAWRSAALVASLDAPLAEALASVPSSPLAVVALGYRLADLGRAPDGFGFLVPRGQGLRALGVLFDSNLFPNRAPAGHVLLRAMIGGAHDPGALELDDDALVRLAREAAAVAGVRADPMLTRVIRHARGIAQYTPGHAGRLAAIEARLAQLPGLLVSGASYRGVALNACVAEAAGIAARLTAVPGPRETRCASVPFP